MSYADELNLTIRNDSLLREESDIMLEVRYNLIETMRF